MTHFRDTVPLDSDYDDETTEKITFGDFDSSKFNLHLVDRTMESPTEQEILEPLPLRQGIYDFSMFKGERFFNNRNVTYEFYFVSSDYKERNYVENNVRRMLMQKGIGKLRDTHDPTYYWQGKCVAVDATDGQGDSSITVKIKFSVYPFAYFNDLEGDDIWDNVEFDHYIWQQTTFDIDKAQTVTLNNYGSRPVECFPDVKGDIKIKTKEDELEVDDNSSSNTSFVLQIGNNDIAVSGKGTVHFKFRREELI